MSVNASVSASAGRHLLPVGVFVVRRLAAYFVVSPMAMAGVAFVAAAALLSLGER